MGYNTTILILNDAFNELKKHPDEFVKAIYEALLAGGDIQVGTHCNAAHVMKTAHADVPRLYYTEGNWIHEIGNNADILKRANYRKEILELLKEHIKISKSKIKEFEIILNEFEKNLNTKKAKKKKIQPKKKTKCRK